MTTTRTEYCNGRLVKLTQWNEAPARDHLAYTEGLHTWELDGQEISEPQADILIHSWDGTTRPRIGAFQHHDGRVTPLVFQQAEDDDVFVPVGWDGQAADDLTDGEMLVDMLGPGQSVVLPMSGG